MDERIVLMHNVILALIEQGRDIDAIEKETGRIMQLSEKYRPKRIEHKDIKQLLQCHAV